MAYGSAVSGLNAATSDLNTIGNNIANSSTTGFKLSRAEFSDVYPASTFGTGSTSIGNGVQLSAVAQQFTQGNISTTSNNLDLAINGQGFFRMSNNGSIDYTRAGAFGVDNQGYISASDGQHLTGYLADSSGTITGALGDLQINTADIAPQATQTVTVGVNLNAADTVPTLAFDPTNSATYNNATSTTVYDSLGATHMATMYYAKTGSNTWNTYLYVDGVSRGGPDALGFTGSGALATINGTAVPPSAINYTAFNPGNGAANMSLALDYGQSTQFGSSFGVNSLTQNGYATGQLTGVSIDNSGIVYANYSNSQSRAQGQVVLTNFANPQGLSPQGNTSWSETAASGSALTGAPGTASLGAIQSGALEQSNVNLTEQLVAMITAQRNFQANAKMISTQETIDQTVINMR
ncbi:MAG: flagellar hook protein FlgE [Acidiferrobacterales bacterium]